MNYKYVLKIDTKSCSYAQIFDTLTNLNNYVDYIRDDENCIGVLGISSSCITAITIFKVVRRYRRSNYFKRKYKNFFNK